MLALQSGDEARGDAMSTSRQRRKRERTIDATAWILGSTIVVLATLDLLVWASVNNVPNPLSKFLAGYGQVSPVPVRHAGR
jgi:hypothetical protein